MATQDITALVQRVRELLHYNRRTGVFTWRVTLGSAPAGSVAGYTRTGGYRGVGIDGHTHLAHRLAWLYVHGVWPTDQIDHRNGVRSDNRLANLREATRSLNGQNQRNPQVGSESGFLGVSRSRKKWRAHIMVDSIPYCLGSFATPEEAHAAYVQAKREHHPGGTL